MRYISIIEVAPGRQIVGAVIETLSVDGKAPAGTVAYADDVSPGWLWNGTKAVPPAATVAPIPFAPAAPEDPLITALYNEAKRRVDTAIDDSASKKYLSWKYDPSSSAARKQKIAENEAWADSIWQMYAACKAKVKAGDRTVQLTPEAEAPKCPWTFWDIANA